MSYSRVVILFYIEEFGIQLMSILSYLVIKWQNLNLDSWLWFVFGFNYGDKRLYEEGIFMERKILFMISFLNF